MSRSVLTRTAATREDVAAVVRHANASAITRWLTDGLVEERSAPIDLRSRLRRIVAQSIDDPFLADRTVATEGVAAAVKPVVDARMRAAHELGD